MEAAFGSARPRGQSRRKHPIPADYRDQYRPFPSIGMRDCAAYDYLRNGFTCMVSLRGRCLLTEIERRSVGRE